jgi:lambda family phage portal protein
MERHLTIAGQSITVKENWLDRAVRFLAPIHGAKRFKARMFEAVTAAYVGASRSDRALSQWNPQIGDADSDAIYDLDILRARSRDLLRNAPLAGGAVNTVVTNVVGTGLLLEPQIDARALGMSDEEAQAWQDQTEREWCLFSESPEVDAARTLNFTGMQELAFRSVLASGDVLVVLPAFVRDGSPYRTKLQLVEADRLSNPHNKPDSDRLAGGVEKDQYGAAVAYHVQSTHPGTTLATQKTEWQRLEAYGKSGRRNVLHLFKPLRPNQSRGVPYLAPVMKPLKQLDRYTDAEIMAAVIAGMYTVFVKSDLGDGAMAPMAPASETGGLTSDEDYKLAAGAIVGLAPGESIETANPGRPNSAFDPFVQAVLRQIGVGLELPFEILIKHFTASYSAARAAILEAWKFFIMRRQWLAQSFCQPVYEAFLWEAVLSGRITAPGFLTDPLLRKAYCGALWIGPAKGMINEQAEVEAAGRRIELGISTRAEETAQLTGGDWDRKHAQQVKEKRMRVRDGLEAPAGVQTSAPAEPGAAGTERTLEDLEDQR